MGIVEIITLLLALAGFGVSPNPNAPTADQALQYAIPDADVVMHVDVTPLIGNNYKRFLALPNEPTIKQSPDLVRLVREVVTQAEGARTFAKGMTGIDFTTDISNATAFVHVVAPNQEPEFVATVRGKLSQTTLDTIASMSGKQATQLGNGKIIEVGGNKPAIAITKDGVMIIGTPKLVKDRLAVTWKSPPHGAGTTLGYAATAIDARPITALVVTLSQTARREITKNFKSPNLVTDLVTRHKAYVASVFADGIGWSWVDSTKAGLDQMAMMSDGFVDIMRASQIAPRGFAKILLGAIDSYKGSDRRVDEIIRRKADIMKIVETYTGDGTFKVAVNKDPAKLRLDVRATGKSLSEVLPAGFFVPAGALFFLTMRSSGGSSMVQPSPSQPMVIQPPAQPKQPLPKPPLKKN